jgi:hypothetical protein
LSKKKDRAPLVEGLGQYVRSTPGGDDLLDSGEGRQVDDGRRRGDQEVAALDEESVKKKRGSVEREVRRKTSFLSDGLD